MWAHVALLDTSARICKSLVYLLTDSYLIAISLNAPITVIFVSHVQRNERQTANQMKYALHCAINM